MIDSDGNWVPMKVEVYRCLDGMEVMLKMQESMVAIVWMEATKQKILNFE